MARKASDYTVADAARSLGMDKKVLERHLRLGDTQFGFYVPGDGGKNGSYYVFRERVEAYVNAVDMRCACPYSNEIA